MAVSRGQLDLRHITAEREREMTATKSGKDGKLTLHPSLHLSISFSRNELKRTSIRQPGKKEGLDKKSVSVSSEAPSEIWWKNKLAT